MFRRWSGSVCSFVLLTCLTACPGADAGSGNEAGSPAADGGGSGAAEPDAGKVYGGDAGGAAASGSSAGNGGSAGPGNDWSPAKDIEPAECLADPSSFAACGGELAGKWRLTSKCFSAGIEALRDNLMCPAAELQEFSYADRMLLEFKSSGNYTIADKQDAVQRVSVPKSCYSDCSKLGEEDLDDSDGETKTITSSADACLLEAQLHTADSVAGIWRVEGSDLTMTDSRGPSTSQFCVNANTLTLKSTNGTSHTIPWAVFQRL